MTEQETIQKINDVMHKGFEVPMEQLTPNARFNEDLGLDSLDAIDMLVHLEENLNVKVDTDDFREVRTLGDIHGLVLKYLPSEKTL